MAHPHEHLRQRQPETERAHHLLRSAGYARGGKIREGDEEQDKKMVKRGVHEHERHMHKGEKETDLHLRGGGKVKGKAPKVRPDRRARGGRMRYEEGGEVLPSNNEGDQQLRSQLSGLGQGVNQAQLPRDTVSDLMNQPLRNSRSVPNPYAQPPKRARGGNVGVSRRGGRDGEIISAPLEYAQLGKGNNDRPPMATGGKVRKGGPSRVNIIISSGGGEGDRQMAFRQGAQTGAALGAAQARMAGGAALGAPPMRPPMPPPGAGAMPPGAPPPGPMPPGAPPMMPPGAGPGGPPMRPPMRRGGKVVPGAGGGGGLGRLHKAGLALRDGGSVNEVKDREKIDRGEGAVRVKAHVRRKAGGRIHEEDCE
jgi:hypothetical protein